MRSITLERARRFETEIDAAVRRLNELIATASIEGLIVEGSIIEFAKLGQAGPTPLLNITVKVRPDQIIKAAEDCA